MTKAKSPFNQVCVWGSTVVGKEKVKAFEDFMKSEWGARVKYLEEIKTLPDMKNGEPVKGTGGRNDVFFVIHDDDITKFAVKRSRMDPPARWIEDVLGNETNTKNGSIYPEHVKKYRKWSYDDQEENIV